jgi:signal transduction histidine kinase
MGMLADNKRWVVLAALVFAVHAAVSFFAPSGFALTYFADVVQTGLLFVIAALAFRNAVRSRGQVRAFWVLMTIGFGTWSVAQVMWAYFELVLKQPVPEPFMGDIVLFVHVVPLMAALVLRPHRTGEIRRLSLPTVDFLLLLLWWMFLYVFTVIPWQLFYDRAQYSISFNLLYTAENVALLIALGGLWLRSQNEWRPMYGHLFIGNALYLLSSQLINAAILGDKYYTGSLYDLPLVISMLWFIGVIAAAGKIGENAKRYDPNFTPQVDALVSRMAMVAIISIPAIAAWSYFGSRTPSQICRFRLATSLGAMLLMAVVLFAKQIMLDRERMRVLAESNENYTKLKRLQAQLVQSEKLAALGQLVSGAAHEINNPLTAILGYSDLISTDEQVDSTIRAHASKIRQQAIRTKDLVLNLLRFARQSDSAKKLVDVNTVVNDTLQLRDLDLQETAAIVERDLESGLPPVWADQTQLLDVCFQLVGNALHAVRGRENARVIIRTRHDSDSVFVEVSDNGEGVADPRRVFDPFYTTKGIGKGPGLGLSACYGMIKEHHGEISCENNRDCGAKFTVRLPLASRMAASTVLPAPKADETVNA